MIVYEDDFIIVCEKPAGMPVQSARIGTPDMISVLKNHRKEKEALQGEPYLGVIHRLDQPVEGMIVFAKTKAAAAALSTQITAGKMKKYYCAVVSGTPKEPKATLVDYLLKDGKTNTSKVVPSKAKGAKRAELNYQVLCQKENITLLEIELLTGRHHQIRVQLSGAGLPLLGDQKYHPGDQSQTGDVALCACKLVFVHPHHKKVMTFQCEPKGEVFSKFR